MSLRTKAAGSLSVIAVAAASLTVVSAGPAFAACDYPPSVVSTTAASGPVQVQYGRGARLSALVDSGSGTPTGDVKFSIDGTSISKTRALSSGVARARLGRGLPARTTYSFTADYLGNCTWKPSSDSRQFKIVRARTQTLAYAPNVSQGDGLRVKVKVGSLTIGIPHGQVQVLLRHHGHVQRSKTVRLRRGVAVASFPGMRALGHWRAVAEYLGGHNYRRSQGVDRFLVMR